MDLETYVAAAAEVMNLPVAAEWKPGVVGFLSLAAEMAAVLERVSLDDAELVLAPVYTPDAFGGREDD